jgi:hypothetical protein
VAAWPALSTAVSTDPLSGCVSAVIALAAGSAVSVMPTVLFAVMAQCASVVCVAARSWAIPNVVPMFMTMTMAMRMAITMTVPVVVHHLMIVAMCVKELMSMVALTTDPLASFWFLCSAGFPDVPKEDEEQDCEEYGADGGAYYRA